MIKHFLFLTAMALSVVSAAAKGPFVFDPSVNEQIGAKLKIPVFYAMPESAYSRTADGITAAAGLWEFRHPGSAGAASPVGLRVYRTQHQDAAKRLAAAGFIQTGDVVLTFRPEWGFMGPYPNIQMGISHAALAVVENGIVSNIDNPLTDEYLGSLDATHYKESDALHIIRPRNLSGEQKKNLIGWVGKLSKLAPKIYPAQISFNQDYTSPKYSGDMNFVKTLGRIALQLDKTDKVNLFCSEFVWALLSLRDCDPGRPEVFAKEGSPACVKPVFAPLPMVGDYFVNQRASSARLGLSDGPLAVIASMGLPEEEKGRLIHKVFETKRQMSPGHLAVAESLAPYYLPLEGYYAGIQAGTPEAVRIMNNFNNSVKPNYSPTSYLVNTLLPEDSGERKMDMVGTVMFSD